MLLRLRLAVVGCLKTWRGSLLGARTCAGLSLPPLDVSCRPPPKHPPSLPACLSDSLTHPLTHSLPHRSLGRYSPVWQSGLLWEFGEGVGTWLLHGWRTGDFCVSLKGDRPLFASLAEWAVFGSRGVVLLQMARGGKRHTYMNKQALAVVLVKIVRREELGQQRKNAKSRPSWRCLGISCTEGKEIGLAMQ